ncbi:hypothetical protein XG19_004216 [Salmonella enterica subsp. enterica serovar Gaminara]|nr:hypothetical protein [Salmonella enterica subsp. enterica serovar Gaminara]ECF2939117.1 hypothetical protein [Salmonella enterica subsp. enterica serovar Reading]ECO0313624.1 hypothetical protein [Salmonella enterica subsp. enterica serovar Schwarzengrund]EDP8790036.1 hypothetical protein [Salmonella enterica subsp. enterica]ECY4705463.1 hypothetical protein [Salmonella enterica subsp. enterica serovar Gaminara]
MIYLLTRCHPFSVYSFVSDQTISLIVSALRGLTK